MKIQNSIQLSLRNWKEYNSKIFSLWVIAFHLTINLVVFSSLKSKQVLRTMLASVISSLSMETSMCLQ